MNPRAKPLAEAREAPATPTDGQKIAAAYFHRFPAYSAAPATLAEMIDEARSARDPETDALIEAEKALVDAAQFMDGVKPEAVAEGWWSGWDTSTRNRISVALAAIVALHTGGKGKVETEGWFVRPEWEEETSYRFRLSVGGRHVGYVNESNGLWHAFTDGAMTRDLPTREEAQAALIAAVRPKAGAKP